MNILQIIKTIRELIPFNKSKQQDKNIQNYYYCPNVNINHYSINKLYLFNVEDHSSRLYPSNYPILNSTDIFGTIIFTINIAVHSTNELVAILLSENQLSEHTINNVNIALSTKYGEGISPNIHDWYIDTKINKTEPSIELFNIFYLEKEIQLIFSVTTPYTDEDSAIINTKKFLYLDNIYNTEIIIKNLNNEILQYTNVKLKNILIENAFVNK